MEVQGPIGKSGDGSWRQPQTVCDVRSSFSTFYSPSLVSHSYHYNHHHHHRNTCLKPRKRAGCLAMSAAPSPRPAKRLREVLSTPTTPKRTYAVSNFSQGDCAHSPDTLMFSQTPRHERLRGRAFPLGLASPNDLPLSDAVSSPSLPGSLTSIGQGASGSASQPSSIPGAENTGGGAADGGSSSNAPSGQSSPPPGSP